MKRWLFNLAAGTSLLMLVAVGIVWVRSYFVQDMLLWYHEENKAGELWDVSAGIGANRGKFSVSHTQRVWPLRRPYLAPFTWWRQDPEPNVMHLGTLDEALLDVLGFSIIRHLQIRYTHFVEVSPGRFTDVPTEPKFPAGWSIGLPLWSPAALSAGLPALWISQWLRARRTKRRLTGDTVLPAATTSVPRRSGARNAGRLRARRVVSRPHRVGPPAGEECTAAEESGVVSGDDKPKAPRCVHRGAVH